MDDAQLTSHGVLYEVRHDTRYAYETSVELAYHLAHLRPLTIRRVQACEYHDCRIDPAPAHSSSSVDVLGNVRLYFSCYAPHQTLVVSARSRVRVQAPADPDWDGSEAWEFVRNRLIYRAGQPGERAAQFAFGSHFAPRFADAGDYAAPSFPPGRPLLQGALALMHRIHADFTYDPASTEAHTRAPQALQLRHGVCQDYAHVMLSALRSLGLAARYVSGYLRSRPPPGQQQLVGADASHAWVEVWCPANGWVEFDPTNNRRPADDYVRLALGRDFADVSPLRGVIRGGGGHTLEVAVRVSPVGTQVTG